MSGANKPARRTQLNLLAASFAAGFVASYFIPTLVVVVVLASAALFIMNHFF